MRGAPSGRWEAIFPLPASHTLIVLSRDPETMVLPSGEKATELMSKLWAFSLLDLSSSVPEKHIEEVSEARRGGMAKSETAHQRPTL